MNIHVQNASMGTLLTFPLIDVTSLFGVMNVKTTLCEERSARLPQSGIPLRLGNKMKKKRSSKKVEPYGVNPDIEVGYEFELSPKVTLVPGDKFKVKGEHGVFVFVRTAKNNKTDTEWVDCKNILEKKSRSFHFDRISKRVK